ncbi:MAG: AAA family ATPase [Candidatus Schekmanbacteria bacterium]|nr:MAG: AAA family ATPase [Candidatus Schekmanbacteria bacterium]
MYKDYYELNAFPFDNVPDPFFYFPSSSHETTLRRSLFAIQNRKGAVMICGEPGCGKTLLIRTLIHSLDSEKYEIGLIGNPSLDTIDLQKEILYQIGVEDIPEDKLDIIHSLNENLLNNFKRGKDTVIFIDEAHIIKNNEIFDEIRLLLNFQLDDRYLLTILLAGQPELRTKISRIPQLEQRISVKCELKPLTYEETVGYITLRLKKSGAKRGIFTKESLDLIYELSGGIPRLINNICDLALLAGYEKGCEQIDTVLVNEVAQI